MIYHDQHYLIRLEWRVWSPPQFPIMNQSILYRRTGKVITIKLSHHHTITIMTTITIICIIIMITREQEQIRSLVLGTTLLSYPRGGSNRTPTPWFWQVDGDGDGDGDAGDDDKCSLHKIQNNLSGLEEEAQYELRLRAMNRWTSWYSRKNFEYFSRIVRIKILIIIIMIKKTFIFIFSCFIKIKTFSRQGWSGLSEPFHFRTAGQPWITVSGKATIVYFKKKFKNNCILQKKFKPQLYVAKNSSSHNCILQKNSSSHRILQKNSLNHNCMLQNIVQVTHVCCKK